MVLRHTIRAGPARDCGSHLLGDKGETMSVRYHIKVDDADTATLDLVSLVLGTQHLLDRPKGDQDRADLERRGQMLLRQSIALYGFRGSEWRISHEIGDGCVEIVVDASFNAERGELRPEPRILQRGLYIAKVEFTHTFMLPPGYERELGRYVDHHGTIAYVSWENIEGGRYKVVATAKTVQKAGSIVMMILEGKIAPQVTWPRHPAYMD